MPETPISDSHLPCTWKPEASCHGCETNGKLMCRLEGDDMLDFLLIILPFGIATIAGMILAGYGWFLLGWLAYSLLFFFVWEAWVLCRHCPFWAEEGRVLRCHANYGVIKFWKYKPGPMSKAEKAQFVIGVLVWVAFPFPFMLLGQEYFLAVVGACAALGGTYVLKTSVCSRCVNFSCPMNGVPKPLVDAYLRRNPAVQAAWEESGYRATAYIAEDATYAPSDTSRSGQDSSLRSE